MYPTSSPYASPTHVPNDGPISNPPVSKDSYPIVLITLVLSLISTTISVLGFVTTTSLSILKELRERRSVKLAEENADRDRRSNQIAQERADRERREWEIKHAEWLAERNAGTKTTRKDNAEDNE